MGSASLSVSVAKALRTVRNFCFTSRGTTNKHSIRRGHGETWSAKPPIRPARQPQCSLSLSLTRQIQGLGKLARSSLVWCLFSHVTETEGIVTTRWSFVCWYRTPLAMAWLPGFLCRLQVGVSKPKHGVRKKAFRGFCFYVLLIFITCGSCYFRDGMLVLCATL